MSTLDTQFIFEAPEREFTVSFAARAIDCGRLFAVAAPRLGSGLLFMVKSSVSRAYTFFAADGINLTVTDTSFTFKTERIRHIRKTPRAAFVCPPLPMVAARRVSVLRL